MNHIKLYNWPHVPSEARTLADQEDIDGIIGVAEVPREMMGSFVAAELCAQHIIDDGAIIWYFIA